MTKRLLSAFNYEKISKSNCQQGDQMNWTKKRPIFSKKPKRVPNQVFTKGFYLVVMLLDNLNRVTLPPTKLRLT